jgi:proteic killer suppression protein
VIRSFRSKALRLFAEKGDPSKLSVPRSSERIRRILAALNAAQRPEDMDIPGNKFHALKGDRKGDYAVWVTGNWRITFAWDDRDAVNVDLEDDH